MMTTNNEVTTLGEVESDNLLLELLHLGSLNPHDPEHRRCFEEYIFSEEGTKELARLNEKRVSELWHFLLIDSVADDDESEEGQEGPPTFSRAVAEYVMEVIPNSLILRDLDFTAFDGDRRIFIARLWDIVLTDNERVLAPDDLQLVLRTIDLNPGGIIDRQPDERGNLLLHISMAFFYNKVMPMDVLRRIHDAFPDAIRHKNIMGRMPLHILCRELELLTERNIQCVEYILSQYPFAASITDNYGYLPFHYLIDRSISWKNDFDYEHDDDLSIDLINKVYNAYPKAVNVRINSKSVLHHLTYEFSMSIISPIILFFLLKKIPQAIFETDKKGYTPLEYINDFCSVWGVIDGIRENSLGLKCHLESTRDNFSQDNILHIFSRVHCAAHGSNHPTKYNKISNHTTRNNNIWNDTKRNNTLYLKLINIFPSLTMERNLYGDVPLHVRLRSGDETNSLFTDIQALVKAMDVTRDSSRAPNLLAEVHIGMLPFMMAACRQEPCVSTILFLLQRFVAERGTLFDIFLEPEQKRESKRQKLTDCNCVAYNYF